MEFYRIVKPTNSTFFPVMGESIEIKSPIMDLRFCGYLYEGSKPASVILCQEDNDTAIEIDYEKIRRLFPNSEPSGLLSMSFGIVPAFRRITASGEIQTDYDIFFKYDEEEIKK